MLRLCQADVVFTIHTNLFQLLRCHFFDHLCRITQQHGAGRRNHFSGDQGTGADQAVAECVEKGIKGKETTPFLLARVAELTGGDSLASNIQLVFNNAKVAALTAVAYCKN